MSGGCFGLKSEQPPFYAFFAYQLIKNVKSNIPYEIVKRYIKKDGSILWVNLKLVKSFNNNEFEYKELCFVEDITQKKLAKDALALSENNFRTIFENSADTIIILNNNIVIDCNKSGINLLGIDSKSNLLGKSICNLSPNRQPDNELSRTKFQNLLNICKINLHHRFEWTYKLKNNTLITTEIILTSINLNGEDVFHALIRDISERKKMEKKLENLSYHDQLTGLYNRRHFEEEMERLDNKKNLPLTIMMGDVNGLKLINDSFGHPVGDQLLKKVAIFIKNGCNNKYSVSRIGGDEFIIIIPHSDSVDIDDIEDRILKYASKEKMNSLDISISFGWATKNSETEDINDILKKAEDYLYKKKLFESPSMRSKNIQTIIHTLYEKNKREERHSRRVSELCGEMGKVLNLYDAEIKELKSAGLLHDIGKIAIDEHILNKEGKLTEDEWIEIKKHPEIGYRILSTVNEMSEMSEYVLSHHERWDGKGYPQNLKGEEIPVKARIINLADSFDAMTSDRTYRTAMSYENAIEEIRKNAGTQFDPYLAKLFIKMVEDHTL